MKIIFYASLYVCLIGQREQHLTLSSIQRMNPTKHEALAARAFFASNTLLRGPQWLFRIRSWGTQNPFLLPWNPEGKTPLPIPLNQLFRWQPALDYLAEQDPLPKELDGMWVFGCDDTHHPAEAADLFHTRLQKHGAKYTITSGGIGWGTPKQWRDFGEGWHMRNIMIAKHSTLSKLVFPETRSTNTQQNAEMSYQLANEMNLPVKRIAVVQGPLYQRRAARTARKSLPGVRIISYAAYRPFLPNYTLPARARLLKDAVREVYRLLIYSGRYFDPIDVSENIIRLALEMSEHLLTDPSLPVEQISEIQLAQDTFTKYIPSYPPHRTLLRST